MRRIIVCGSRGWADRKVIADTLSEVATTSCTIVHGKCPRGADRIADEEARRLGFAVECHPADWGRYGKKAGILRNIEMAQLGAELCIAFWDGQSLGTENMIYEAKLHGIPVRVVS